MWTKKSRVVLAGKEVNLFEALESYGVSRSAFRERMKLGMTAEEAITTRKRSWTKGVDTPEMIEMCLNCGKSAKQCHGNAVKCWKELSGIRDGKALAREK